ncbi:MAG: LCP family protein [Limnochordia bacterium]
MLSPEELTKQKQLLAEKRKLKAERQKRRFLFYILTAIIAAILMIGTFFVTYRHGTGRLFSRSQGRVNILILGSDATAYDPGRTDTIILATVDADQGQLGLLSIPRDTRVSIPGRRGYHRINSAHAFGGPDLVRKTVEEFLGVDINYYVSVDFAGFAGVVDTLGGVEIEVEKAMRYDDFAQGLHIDLKPGRQILNGEQALQYIRYRDGLGDIALLDPVRNVYGGRIQRQQKFLQAVVDKALRPQTIGKIPQLAETLRAMVDTDLPVDEAVALGLALKKYTPDRIDMAVVPGIGRNVGNASYWVADEDQLVKVVNSLFNSGPAIVTVEVLNGNGRSGVAGVAADRLQDHGYQIVNVGNAERFDYQETEVRFRSSRKEAAQHIAGLLSEQVVVREDNSTQSDILVIVGRDFQI